MKYQDLIDKYKEGTLTPEQAKKVRQDIDRQEAIEEYLADQAELGFEPGTLGGRTLERGPWDIPSIEQPTLDYSNMGMGTADYTEGMKIKDEQFAKLIRKAVRRALRRAALIGSICAVIVVLFIMLILPRIVDGFYYNPGKIIVKSDDKTSSGYDLNQMGLDISIYTELMAPASSRSRVSVVSRGWGNYEIVIPQELSFNSVGYHDISGHISRNRLTLYDTNYLNRPDNVFAWTSREDIHKSLREQDVLEDEKYGKNAANRPLHAGFDVGEQKQTLTELDSHRTYVAYVTFDRMLSYSKLKDWWSRQRLSNSTLWCAVDTGDGILDEKGKVTKKYAYWPENLGFFMEGGSTEGQKVSLKDYPQLLMTSHKEKNVKTHVTSMIRYMGEQDTFRKMMGIFTLKDDESGASADQKIDYINTYGLRIYGVMVYGDKQELTDLAKEDEVYLVYPVEAE
ncbi:MAG: anti sigma factor C-terminal domain-containing protein [Lachnospiraceae bacterium]|nr:anti sigma factor C-terminal domain-containing protein [Lachnospiraceae bacterium]